MAISRKCRSYCNVRIQLSARYRTARQYRRLSGNSPTRGVFQVTESDLRSLMFGDYMNPDLDPEEKVYEEVKSIDIFYSVAEQCMEEYNNTHKNRMELVIFRSVNVKRSEGHHFSFVVGKTPVPYVYF